MCQLCYYPCDRVQTHFAPPATAEALYQAAGAPVSPPSVLWREELLQLYAFVMLVGTSAGYRMNFACKVSSGLRGTILQGEASDPLQPSVLLERGSNAAWCGGRWARGSPRSSPSFFQFPH